MTTVSVAVSNLGIPRLREIDGYLFGGALGAPGTASRVHKVPISLPDVVGESSQPRKERAIGG